MEEKKPIAFVIVALIAVVGVGIWLFSGKDVQNDSGEEAVVQEVPASVEVEVTLTPEEKSGDVSSKKAEILGKINSGAVLTTEEKQEITLIMATKANIYNFTEEERKAIFAAFNK
ncbi:hypothetical protein COU76_00010 [Candidatus Peregrinibacteria bacterium CG10_big_fil_rev_8_21_14_0_10_49_10]|nr:MAG: hypothetical protein COU76_00010 [Candidatus Peregrinibacteria bacterium CG10_big_fil_rev_8_21_14_0_10_49_10]